jgi:hypothetical protein
MMNAIYDIFLVEDHGVHWLGAAATIEEAEAQVRRLGGQTPGEYILLNQLTGNKTSIKVDCMSAASGK